MSSPDSSATSEALGSPRSAKRRGQSLLDDKRVRALAKDHEGLYRKLLVKGGPVGPVEVEETVLHIVEKGTDMVEGLRSAGRIGRAGSGADDQRCSGDSDIRALSTRLNGQMTYGETFTFPSCMRRRPNTPSQSAARQQDLL